MHRFKKDTQVEEVEATDKYHAEDLSKTFADDLGIGDWVEILKKPEDQIGLDLSYMDNEKEKAY